MKSIKCKILTAIILLVSVSLILVGGTSVFLNYNSTMSLLEQIMKESAGLASDRVSKELVAYQNIATEAGSIARLAKPETPIADKKSIIDQRTKTYGFQRGNILDSSGKSIFDGNDYSDREYFKVAMEGSPFISKPIVSKITGELTVIIAAPLWESGVPGTKVVGVVYFVPKETFLNDIMASINISKNSQAYIIDDSGDTVADVSLEAIKNNENIEKMAKTDKSLQELADLHVKMKEGKAGFDTYKIHGVKQILAYEPIKSREGWTLGITAPVKDFMAATTQSVIATVILLTLAMLVSVLIALKVANKISNPIMACTKRLTQLAEGDLKSDIPEITTSDETGILAGATGKIVKDLNDIISDLARQLAGIANGDLTMVSMVTYPGDFAQLQRSLESVFNDLNQTLDQINQAAEQVAAGAEQMSAGAQALSQGTMEQASSIEELSATITEISDKVAGNADISKFANQISKETGSEVQNGNHHMLEMVRAMNEISETSGEIGKIIKTIEDIAFQTNILALNAAVEAARAGQAGKGFAVVADEVRNLAQKSAEAAQNTTALIESAVSAVKNGMETADDTAKSLEVIVEKVGGVTEQINKITDGSVEQADSINQVTQGVDQIASVVQTNSATAEESAATSEELNAQAQMLKSLVEKFQLR
ncbi:methyl-accepting chemotaxis protein [Aminipila terrae]|uniref:HAMP domain-containing protein n=1 Tax=Aminipila terrae TaxID=2697030 RepID=A0A6P1MHJ1_9FIRM|nr:methyl-accepting chemotaxis protein [Aminipila terrae]QHI73357.1 HAMP domain-containing protein [Aminipila terrae]